MTKILLGRLKADAGTFGDGENIWLEHHEWACGWYWAFGYLGNRNLHFHFESLLQNSKCASELFQTTNISDNDWWLLRDLFKQTYTLKAAAETYRYGGHQTHREGVTDVLRDAAMAAKLNADCKIVLDLVWALACEAVKPKTINIEE